MVDWWRRTAVVDFFFTVKLFYGLYKPQKRKKISIVIQFVQTAKEKKF